METIKVLAVGSEVLLDGAVSARITAIFIRDAGITYEVVWWNERERHEEVLEPWELKPNGEKARKARVSPIL